MDDLEGKEEEEEEDEQLKIDEKRNLQWACESLLWSIYSTLQLVASSSSTPSQAKHPRRVQLFTLNPRRKDRTGPRPLTPVLLRLYVCRAACTLTCHHRAPPVCDMAQIESSTRPLADLDRSPMKWKAENNSKATCRLPCIDPSMLLLLLLLLLLLDADADAESHNGRTYVVVHRYGRYVILQYLHLALGQLVGRIPRSPEPSHNGR